MEDLRLKISIAPEEACQWVGRVRVFNVEHKKLVASIHEELDHMTFSPSGLSSAYIAARTRTSVP